MSVAVPCSSAHINWTHGGQINAQLLACGGGYGVEWSSALEKFLICDLLKK